MNLFNFTNADIFTLSEEELFKMHAIITELCQHNISQKINDIDKELSALEKRKKDLMRERRRLVERSGFYLLEGEEEE